MYTFISEALTLVETVKLEMTDPVSLRAHSQAILQADVEMLNKLNIPTRLIRGTMNNEAECIRIVMTAPNEEK